MREWGWDEGRAVTGRVQPLGDGQPEVLQQHLVHDVELAVEVIPRAERRVRAPPCRKPRNHLPHDHPERKTIRREADLRIAL